MRNWLGRVELRGTSHDKQCLSEFLVQKRISPEGPFKAVLDGDWEPAWRYVAWVVKRYPNHPMVTRKLKKLAGVSPRKGISVGLVNVLKSDYEESVPELNSRYVRSKSEDDRGQILALIRNSERDYKTGLLEFKALYILAELGYEFMDADVKVGGTGRCISLEHR